MTLSAHSAKWFIKLALPILLLCHQGLEAKTMYRWVDEQGRVSFSDQVPPTQAQHQREVLDKNAQVISVTEKAKTKEQIEMDKRLTLLRRQQELIIAKQNAEDKALLSSFLDVPSMEANRKNKIQAFNSQENEKRTEIARLKTEIANQQRQAADPDGKGQKAPEDLLRRIDNNQKEVAKIKAEIVEILNNKALFEKKYAEDLQRFKYLTANRKNTAAAEVSVEKSTEPPIDQLGLFSCNNSEQCDAAWRIARGFVKSYSTTPITIDTDKVITSAAPALAKDLSLSISKMTVDDNKLQIFLDIRCTETMSGSQLCANSQAAGLRAQFIDTIKLGLGLK
jgi:hypothetical protein